VTGTLKSRDLTTEKCTRKYSSRHRNSHGRVRWHTLRRISTRLVVYPDADGVAGCWFQVSSALKEACGSDADVQNVSLVNLPLLPAEEIVAAIDDVEAHVHVDSSLENQLRQLIRHVKQQWIHKRSVGPERLSDSACTITKAKRG